MDKKGWPWKKKSLEKIASAPDTIDSSQCYDSKEFEEQDVPKIVGDLARVSETTPQMQQADATVKALNEQLSAAISDLTDKDNLVKQHMKVAEEAVTGWERAEAEAVDLKQKLDVALQQKLATEDRVSHLDGALKECMRQLRHVREEQEQRIHDTVVKKTRDWEKIRTDLEAKLVDVSNQLCEALAENKAMSKSLQERGKSIFEINDVKTRVEAENNVLQVRLGVLEKENAKFRYELHVQGKDLEIRNEERDYYKKSGEAASKQHLENIKKIAKLETECQRLRLLVRKRLPGPGALAQMKSEVDALGKETGERNRKRSPCRRNGSSPSALPVEVPADSFLDGGLRESEILSDRLLAMEEETKLLKEVLAKRNHELQDARLMCARTASKLSNVEEQLESLSRLHSLTRPALDSSQALGASKEPSLASVSEGGAEDGVQSAESWASALIVELAQFKKDKASLGSEKTPDSSNFDMMDDFAEMEKLASMPSKNDGNMTEKFEKVEEMTDESGERHLGQEEEPKDSEGLFRNKEHEFRSVDQLCKELRNKLANAEEQLNVLQAKQLASEATIQSLQQCLATIFQAEAKGTNLSKALEDVKTAMEANRDFEATQATDPAQASSRPCLEIVSSEDKIVNVWSPSCHSEGCTSKEDAVVSSVSELDFCAVGPELAAAVRKVLDLVEGIAQTDYDFAYSQWIPDYNSGPTSSSENGEDHECANLGKPRRSSGLDACVESLITLCNSLVQGKVDIIDFMAEVASAMEWLVGLIFSVPDKSSGRICMKRQIQWSKGSPSSSHSEVTSAGSSPAPTGHKVSNMEKDRVMELHDAVPDHSSVSDASSQFSGTSTHDEELIKITSEKAALEMRLEAEIQRAACFECEIVQLKSEKDNFEHNHKLISENLAKLNFQIQEANEKLLHMNNQLQESECQAAHLQSQLKEALEEKQSVENTLAALESVKEVLESQLNHAKANMKKLEEKVLAMEAELQEEMKCRKDIEIKFQELQQEQEQITGGVIKSATRENELVSSGLNADEEAARLKKEQEIAAAAEKLAECQQTILLLGKQLKALGAPKEAVEVSFSSPVETTSLPNKLASTTQRFRSSSDQVHCESDARDDMYYSGTEDPRASPGFGWPRNDRERSQEHGSSRSSRNNHTSSFQEADVGLAVRRGQTSDRYGRQSPSELLRVNTFPSPTHGDYQEGSVFVPSSQLEPVMSSPSRSPARFLSLRNRTSSGSDSSKHGESESAEKHGTGFSRFFLRTRSGH